MTLPAVIPAKHRLLRNRLMRSMRFVREPESSFGGNTSRTKAGFRVAGNVFANENTLRPLTWAWPLHGMTKVS